MYARNLIVAYICDIWTNIKKGQRNYMIFQHVNLLNYFLE